MSKNKNKNLLEQDSSEEVALKGIQRNSNNQTIFGKIKGNKKGHTFGALEETPQSLMSPTDQDYDHEAQTNIHVDVARQGQADEEVKYQQEQDDKKSNTVLTNYPSNSNKPSLFTLGNMGTGYGYGGANDLEGIANMKQLGSDSPSHRLMLTPAEDGPKSDFQNLIQSKNVTVGGMNKVSDISQTSPSPGRMKRSSTLLTKQALQVMKETSSNKITKPKNGTAWWPMEVGKANDDDENNEAIQNLKNHDVYPLSISYSKRVQRKMKIYRIISLLFCMYVISPISIYYDAPDFRIGFYANTDKIVDIKLKDVVNNTFTLDITNCQTFWFENTESTDAIKFQLAYAYGTPFTQNKTQITIKSPLTSKVQCIVHAFFPLNVTLPNFIMKMNGTLDNQVIDDGGLHGQTLNFGNNSLSIQGQSAYINLNNHIMSTLNITLQYSLCNIRRIIAVQKNIFITFGYYNELIHADSTANIANVVQNSGIICLVAPYVQEIARNDTCLTSKLGNATCSQQAYLCGDSGFCNEFQQVLNVVVKDGPVQIRYFEQYTDPYMRNPALYVNNTISMGVESKIKLNITANIIKADSGNDRIAVLQTVGIDYEQTWAYTNRFAYLEAQVWPLSFVSLTLLRPIMSYQKVVVVDDQCPARSSTLQFQSEISDFYTQFMPATSDSLVTLVVGMSQFYKVQYSASGDYQLTQLKFQDNPLMVAAFIIAGVLSILASLTISFGFVELFKLGKKQYAQYIENQRKLVFTKYQAHLVETEGHSNLDKQTFQQSQYVEIRGVFTSVMQKESKSQKKSQSQQLLQINFSIFQIPALFVDYIFRKFADSLKGFILTIDQSKYHFTDRIMRKGNLLEISVPLSEFQKQYSNYCQIMGCEEVLIETKLDVLKQFSLFINYQKEIEKAAYANMRFKTMKEKQQRLASIGDDPNQNGPVSLINQFLADQCIASSFADDFIFLEDLEKAFLRYCDMKDKPEAERTQIVNSDEIKTFGAVIKHYPPHPVVVGITQGRLENINPSKDGQIEYKSGFIRKKFNIEGETRLQRVLYAIKVELKNQSDPDKFSSNFLIVVIHFAMTIIFPFILSAIVFLGLSEMTRIQQGVFADPVTLTDVIYPNRLRPFFNELPYFNYFLDINIYSVVFLFCSLLELLSFYLNNCDNQGKFPVRYTVLKRIIVRSHQFFLFFVMYIIFCMISLGLIWAVLGAIINPTKFLPYAAASITFINTIMTKYTATKKKYALIIAQFMKLIHGVMEGIVAASIAKLMLLQSSKFKQPAFLKVQKKQNLSSDIKGMIKMNVPEESEKEVNLQNATNLSKIASNHLGGLQPTIIETALAIQSGKQGQIIVCVEKLSNELHMDKELMMSIVELGMSTYNPDKYGIRELDGNVLVSIKKLFRRLFPQLNVDLLGQIILLVTEGDSKALVKLLDKHSFKYQSLFYVLIFAMYGQKDKTMLKKVLLRFVEEIFEKDDLSEIFSLLIMSQDGDIKFIIQKMKELPSYYENKNRGPSIWGKLNQVGKNPYTQIQKIGFEKFAPLICMIAMQQKNPSLTRLVINLVFEEKINEMSEIQAGTPTLQGNEKTKVFDTLANKFYQCLYLICKGEDIDFKNLNKLYVGIEMNTNLLEELHNCAYNSPTSFSFILNSINCTASKQILLEFYQFCCKKSSDAIHICQAIKIGKEKSKSVSYLIIILYRIFKFELKLQQFIEEKQSERRAGKKQLKIEQELKIIKKKILKMVILLNDRENFFSSFEFDKLKLIQTNNNLLDNSFEASLGPEDVEEFDDGNGKVNKKLQMIIDTAFSTNQSFIKADEKAKGEQAKETIPVYQVFFKLILETQQIKFFLNQKGKQYIRSYAIVMLKADDDIQQNDANYINCLKSLSDLFKVPLDLFEFLVDSISGSALDIFKVQSKNVVLSQDKSEFVNVEFDMARSNIISKYLKVDPAFLNKICAYWYNESLIISQAKSKMPLFLKKFKIKPEFVKILQEFKESQEENNELFDQINFQQLIIKYLNKGIEERQKLQNEQQSESKNYYFEQTDLLFSAQDNKEYTLNDTVNAISLNETNFDFMSSVLKIKEGDTKILKTLMDTKHNPDNAKGYLKTMKLILSVRSQSHPGTFFNILQKLSKLIPLFEDYKIDDKGKHKIKHNNQNLFVQLTILINSFQLQSLCRNRGVDEVHLGKVVHNMIELANKHNKQEGLDEVLQFKNIDCFNLLRNLYDNDYFQNIAKKLFECLGKNTSIKQCNLALGIMLGATSEDVSLLRQSVIGLLAEKNRLSKEKDTNLIFLNGLAGALQNDLESKNDILKVCKQLDLEGALITDIIDLMSDKPKNFPQMMHNLFEEIQSGSQFQIFTSLIYLLKNDLSNIKPISKMIGVEPDKLLPILAAAVGNTQLLSSFYTDIAEKFGLQNHNSVRFTIEISKGETQCFQQLSLKRLFDFYIPQPELFTAVIYLISTGKKVFGQKVSNAQQLTGYLGGALSHLYRQLRLAFGFDIVDPNIQSKREKQGMKQINQKNSKKLKDSLHILFNALWNDQQFIEIIVRKLHGGIWNSDFRSLYDAEGEQDYQTFTYQIKETLFKTKLQQVVDQYDLKQKKLLQRQKELMNVLKTNILPFLDYQAQEVFKVKKPEYAEYKIEAQRLNYLIKLQRFKDKLLNNSKDDIDEYELSDKVKDNQLYAEAFQIGCTFGLGLFKKLRQPIYYCLSCNRDVQNEALNLCLPCALFCHKGHIIKARNYGPLTKTQCDCGTGKFSSSKRYLNQSPLNHKTKLKDNGEKSTVWDEQWTCSVLRKHVNKMQKDLNQEMMYEAKAKKLMQQSNKKKTEEDKLDELIDNYSDSQFFQDIAKSIELPDYYGHTSQDQIDPRNKFLSRIDIENGIKLYGIYDDYLDRPVSFVENLILLSSGRSTDSFTALLASQAKFGKVNYKNQSVYDQVRIIKGKKKQNSRDAVFKTLSCFISIVKGDRIGFQRYGQGYCDVLGESGTSDYSAKDNMVNILILSNGGKLPMFQSEAMSKVTKKLTIGLRIFGDNQEDKKEEEKKLKMNTYQLTLYKMFGAHGKKVMALHKLLTLNKRDLLKLAQMNDSEGGHDMEFKNLHAWINDLLGNLLQQDSKNQDWIKSVIRLCCNDIDGINFIAQEKKISPKDTTIYKGLLNANLKNIIPVFEDLSMFIDMDLNIQLFNVWKYDEDALISFIFENAFNLNPKDETVETIEQKKYMKNLYQILAGNTLKLNKRILKMLIFLLNKEKVQEMIIEIENIGQFDDDEHITTFSEWQLQNESQEPDTKKKVTLKSQYPELYRYTNALLSIHGIISDNFIEIPYICKYFDVDQKVINENLASSLISIPYRIWTSYDIQIIYKKLMKVNKNLLSDNNEERDKKCIEQASSILSASEGDLISLGKVSDEIFALDCTHMKSLIVSLITGNTKYDLIQEKSKKNLLKREIYYVYEKIVRLAFKEMKIYDSDTIDQFLVNSFEQKMPLLLFSAISEDVKLAQKIFDPAGEFSQTLVRKPEENENSMQKEVDNKKGKDYLNCFMDFIYPSILTENIKPLLKYMKLIKGQQITKKKLDIEDYSIYKDFGKLNISINKLNQDDSDHIKFNQREVIETIMSSLQLDKRAFISLYKTFHKLFDNIPVLSNILTLIVELMEERKHEIFDNLPSVVALILKMFKDQCFSDQEFNESDKLLMNGVVKWMEFIMIILDKENKYNDKKDIKLKLVQTIQTTLDFYAQTKDSSHCLKNQQSNPIQAVDVLLGMMNMAKMNFSDMKQMALKIGGFPQADKLEQFFKVTSKHSVLFNFGQGEVKKPPKDLAKGGNEELSEFNMKSLFDHFAKNNKGVIGVEEFQNCCKHMGITALGGRELKVFASVDKKHTGKLTYQQFSQALLEMQLIIVKQSMDKVGVSVNTLVLGIVWTITILILLITFIFIGIEAFSPVNQFSSVMNSLMPIGAGLVSKGKTAAKGDKGIKGDKASSAVSSSLGKK